MKLYSKFLFILLLLNALNGMGQCFPVFAPMQKQFKPASTQTNFEYYSSGFIRHEHFFCTYKQDLTANKIDTMIFYLWNDTGWLTMSPLMYKSYPTSTFEIMKSGPQIYLTCELQSYNGNTDPSGQHYSLLEYNNGTWSAVPDCLKYNNQTIFYATNRQGLYKTKTSGLLQNFYLEHFNPVTKVFDTVCTYQSVQGLSPYNQIIGGNDRLLIPGIESVNGIPTNGFAYIDTSTLYLNDDTAFKSGYPYCIDPKTDFIYHTSFTYNGRNILEYNKKLLSKRAFAASHYPGTIMAVKAYNNKLLIDYWDPTDSIYLLFLCPGETEWKTDSRTYSQISI